MGGSEVRPPMLNTEVNMRASHCLMSFHRFSVLSLRTQLNCKHPSSYRTFWLQKYMIKLISAFCQFVIIPLPKVAFNGLLVERSLGKMLSPCTWSIKKMQIIELKQIWVGEGKIKTFCCGRRAEGGHLQLLGKDNQQNQLQMKEDCLLTPHRMLLQPYVPWIPHHCMGQRS